MLKFMLPANYRIMMLTDDAKYTSQALSRVKELIEKYNICVVNRKKELVFKRQLICWYLKKNTKLTLYEIGEICGGKNHATVLHAVRSIDNYKGYNDKYFTQVTDELNTDLKNTFINGIKF
ncbi:Chromosomal replication initiator, DnaA C-terminal [uncultured Caudovirales phage]|uniref:Chromosomal replication initiator, DnaA C-terminal n=1 Tax=uncultured Caudovirales phage TaxID=2100421 RepID=A0A6J5L4N6_9CAUD|nr:Chromosomal replication initiator, DnaA C-terminal [uncultured Caudovirales phage]CAB4134016.1 Chromosomal replication initiator, DnaA C-terminal [uncultured Caudovirales phage]